MVKVNRPAHTALATILALSMATPISGAYAQDTATHNEQPPPIEAVTNSTSNSSDKTTSTDTLPSLEENTTNDSEATSTKDEVDKLSSQTGTSNIDAKIESTPESTTSKNETRQFPTLKRGRYRYR